ncbi:YoaK family protein [Bradyrhizobium genosp. A]|uniref:YoaK family protein n=1 Tax=Bradyrhizobium genosp. A TaxID=83626 RepID=UPI003CF8F30D
MSTLDIAAASSIRRDETVEIALLLAFAGGYIDAYTWIIHGVMANAQTANLVLLWVYGMAGDWDKALHFGPPIIAFAIGVVIAAWLRRVTGERAAAISTLIEILLLIAIGILHNRLPDLAGTLGISCVAAMQATVFTRVEGAVYSTVMITGNMRQAIEGIFIAASGGRPAGTLRRSGIFTAVCVAFGLGAAVGAFATKSIPDLALGIPVIALLIVLLRCEVQRHEASR